VSKIVQAKSRERFDRDIYRYIYIEYTNYEYISEQPISVRTSASLSLSLSVCAWTCVCAYIGFLFARIFALRANFLDWSSSAANNNTIEEDRKVIRALFIYDMLAYVSPIFAFVDSSRIREHPRNARKSFDKDAVRLSRYCREIQDTIKQTAEQK